MRMCFRFPLFVFFFMALSWVPVQTDSPEIVAHLDSGVDSMEADAHDKELEEWWTTVTGISVAIVAAIVFPSCCSSLASAAHNKDE
mmetsp:Transcript_49889/g.132536  ORF Transcript_49889/g.132536 Transcript_49889/m.132536 type:complete len:86 (-) Transcript_49889:102-359(-)